MPLQSTRVARVGPNLEVHLKNRLQVTSGMVNDIATLPPSDEWVIVNYDPQSDTWTAANTFSNFVDADDFFVTRTSNQGLSKTERLGAGIEDPADGRGREIT